MCAVIWRNKSQIHKSSASCISKTLWIFSVPLWERSEKCCGGVQDRELDGKSGRQGTNEISQLWFDPSHVMVGPPLPHSDFLTLPFNLPAPKVSLASLNRRRHPLGALHFLSPMKWVTFHPYSQLKHIDKTIPLSSTHPKTHKLYISPLS